MKLSRPQIDMLRLHLGTNNAKPRRRMWGAATTWDQRREVSIFNPTASSLENRGLMKYRGFNGKTPGGWYITKAGTKALIP